MDEKEREKVQEELRKVGDEFLKAVEEIVDSSIILCDVQAWKVDPSS